MLTSGLARVRVAVDDVVQTWRAPSAMAEPDHEPGAETPVALRRFDHADARGDRAGDDHSTAGEQRTGFDHGGHHAHRRCRPSQKSSTSSMATSAVSRGMFMVSPHG